MPELLQQVDAEPPVRAVDVAACGRSRPRRRRSKILRFRSFISGKQSRTISSSSIGPRFIGRSVPLTRTIGGLPTLRCKSLALSFTQARNSLSISRSCLRFDEAARESASSMAWPWIVTSFDAIVTGRSSDQSHGHVASYFVTAAAGRGCRARPSRCLVSSNRILAEVENAGRQGRVGLADRNRVGQVLRLARPRRWRRPGSTPPRSRRA